MIDRVARLVGRRGGRVLIVAAAFFLLAGAFGGPVVGRLKAQSSDFVDPAAPSLEVDKLIRQATARPAEPGVVAIARTYGDIRSDPRAARKVTRLAALLAGQPGVLSVVEYAPSRLPTLTSAGGRESIVLASFPTRGQSNAAVETLRRRLDGHRVTFGDPDVGAVIAVALDATAIRGLLVPALLGVSGDHAWSAPRPLRRLHAAVGLAEG